MSSFAGAIQRAIGLPADNSSIVGASVLATIIALLGLSQLTPKVNPGTRTPGPGTTVLPGISSSEIDELPYPPDALPGGRSVESPVFLKRPWPLAWN